MADLKLTMACGHYDRTRAILDGSVRPDGIDLHYLDLFPADIFPRLLGDKEFEVSEMGLTFYISLLDRGDPPYIAIPVFPSRTFRHSAIIINTASGIESPADLIGKRVGELFVYGHDAGIWAKGILSDEYGVPFNSVSYFVGGLEKGAARWDWLPVNPAANVRIEYIGPTRILDNMLEAGEIDALYAAMAPPSLIKGSKNVKYLFDSPEPLERAWFKKTGIFPIMHTIVIRKDIYQRHPWVAQALYKAFSKAKQQVSDLYSTHDGMMHKLFMIPWLTTHFEENRKLMGDDPWPYGLESNRKTLDTFLRYHHEQGLSRRRFSADEIFAPETLRD